MIVKYRKAELMTMIALLGILNDALSAFSVLASQKCCGGFIRAKNDMAKSAT